MSDDPAIPPANSQPDPEPPKTFSQEEVNRMMTREKQEGSKTAISQLLEKLGVQKVEDIESILTTAKEREDAEKTEIQRLTEAKETAERARAEETSNLQQNMHTERVRTRLLRAGVPLPDEGADAALDRLVALVSVPVGASVEDIDGDITNLKGQFPAVFTASPPNPGPPSSMPSGTPTRTPASGETALERAARIAQENNKARGVQTPTA